MGQFSTRLLTFRLAVPPKEVSKSATPPKIDLPPPSKLKDMDHLVATLETVGVGATVSPFAKF